VLVCLALHFLPPVAGAAPPPEDIAQAVRELGDDRFSVREKASAFLQAAGRAAEPALRAALKSRDPEVVRRAGAILDQFKWGIYPDTPKEIVDLVTRYRSADRGLKQALAHKLLERGAAGVAVVTKLAGAEPDEVARQVLLRQLVQEQAQLVPGLAAEGQLATLEELLEVCSPLGEEAARNYAAYLLVRGRLDEAIAAVKARTDPPSAEVLTYLYRAKGDLAGARQAAERAGNPRLVEAVLWEQGAWKELLDRHRPQPGGTAGDAVEALALRAAYQRRAGAAKDFEATLAELRRLEPGQAHEDGELWHRAKALLLHDRPAEAIGLLVKGGEPARAFELLAAQMRVREALALADGAAGRARDDRFRLDVLRARTLYNLGETDKALALFTRLAGEVTDPAIGLDLAAQLIDAEYGVGLADQAQEHCALLLARAKDDAILGALLAQAFPEKSDAAAAWWAFLTRQFPDEPAPATMKRLRGLLAGKTPLKELEALARGGEAARLGPAKREAWWLALAEAFRAADGETQARAVLEKAAADPSASSAPGVKLGDWLVEHKLWTQAAEQYDRAWRKDRGQPLPLYLRGLALVRAGRNAQGQKLMDLAHLVPLAGEQPRHTLAAALAERGRPDAARREYDLIVRTGQFNSWYVSDSRRHFAQDALARKDYLAAAGFYERSLLDCLRAGTGFERTAAYVVVPSMVHRIRARGLLAAGRADEAREETRLALTASPGSVDVCIDLVPALEKAGRKREADDLFDQVFALYERLAADYPRFASGHNSLAWLAARCHRRLDRALEHAQRAVALAPKEAGYRDTLAEVHFQRGEKDRAIDLMKQCVALEPKNDYFRKQLRRFQAGDPTAEVPEEQP
jgi:tetratricopeptide (TPR) repeat protein